MPSFQLEELAWIACFFKNKLAWTFYYVGHFPHGHRLIFVQLAFYLPSVGKIYKLCCDRNGVIFNDTLCSFNFDFIVIKMCWHMRANVAMWFVWFFPSRSRRKHLQTRYKCCHLTLDFDKAWATIANERENNKWEKKGREKVVQDGRERDSSRQYNDEFHSSQSKKTPKIWRNGNDSRWGDYPL